MQSRTQACSKDGTGSLGPVVHSPVHKLVPEPQGSQPLHFSLSPPSKSFLTFF